ncbi:MAG: mobilization protein [Alphaproteobacteria bacterium]|nr:mobilization protein [Alphaproteobacteria bacterium]
MNDETNIRNDGSLSTQKPKKSLSEKISESRLLITEPIEKPQTVLSINESDFQSVLCTLGNISLIQGQAKSRKSFLMSFVVTALITGKYLKFTGSMPEEKRKILFFDTEQGLFHSKKVQERIYRLSGLSVDAEFQFLEFYNLRPYNYKERIEIINHLILSKNDVGFVIIDGIRDLVKDINDAGEATNITGLLMKWSDQKEIHIMNVLHENKGDRNSRGHVGSELQNKSESVIRVSREPDRKDFSRVEPVFLRDRDFEEFLFSISNEGDPELVEKFSKRTYCKPAEMDTELHQAWVREVFTRDPGPLSQNQYITLLKAISSEYEIKLGDNALRDWVTYHFDNGLIANQGTTKNFKIISCLT